MQTENKLPNFIIAGTVKSGSTSLYSYLAQHPDVCASLIKETCYFLPLRYGGHPAPIEEYHKQFAHHQNEKVIMEATPGYFQGGGNLVQAIQTQIPHTKILIVLREPISRILSFFNFQKSRLHLDEDMTFKEYVEACHQYSAQDLKEHQNLDPYYGLEGGKYIDYIKVWEAFPKEQIKFYFFDDIKRDSRQVMKDLCQWLGITPDFYDDFEFTVENKTVPYKNKTLQKLALAFNEKNEAFFRKNQAIKKRMRDWYYKFNAAPKKEAVDANTRQQLEQFYQPYNARLGEYLQSRGIACPDWLNN